MKNRRKGIVLFTACIAASAAGITCAYLTSADHADNSFSVAKVDITVTETFNPPDDPKPGDKIIKAPRVHSDSDVDCYVRIMAIFTNDGDKMCEPLKINSGWTLKEDGYYYWDQLLAPGQDTDTLFESIQIRADVDEEDMVPFDVLVYSECVQAAGRTAGEAWASMGV